VGGPEDFVYLVLGGLALVVIALMLIGHYYPGSGAEVLDWKPTRSAELEAELEQNDIEQMLDAQNGRRRLRGAPERTLEDLEQDVTRNLMESRDLQRMLYEPESSSGDSAWQES
jgi:hypothetical protein